MVKAGDIAWTDLTVENAELIRDFYQAVVGWQAQPVDMKGYSDFSMASPVDGEPRAGVCHARGANADLPAQWLVYIIVENLESSMNACRRLGGKLLAGPKSLGEGARYCVICDPAGAVCALYEVATDG
jgi:predicted enzyme related to lactoylglutathione lyase